MEEIIDALARLKNNPLAYALWAYPWGEEGTELEEYSAPDLWQQELFRYIGDELSAGNQIVRVAVKSGHGIGKSAASSILIDWGMSTFVGTKGVVTANTERQLRTKTWVELAKWRRLSLTKDFFRIKATSLFSNDPDLRSEWRFDMAPWSERNTEAFAGLHNKGKRIVLIMDEASAISDLVFETAEGALTDKNTQIIIILFGNPTRNTGRFRECFDDGKHAHRWKQITVDSRESAIANQELIKQWGEDYGEDSDFFRVRARGLFPKHDVSSLIPRELVQAALNRKLEYTPNEPVVLGVDVARFGDDSSVIFPRQGRDGSSRKIERYQSLNTVQLAERVAAAYARYDAKMIYVDTTGVGAGVVDNLRAAGFPVHEVNFASKPDGIETSFGSIRLANKRAEIWSAMRDWLVGASLQDFEVDKDHSMLDDLTTTNYFYNKDNAIQLEPKDEIKRREGFSPDIADALACTFAMPALIDFAPLGRNNFEEPEVAGNPYRRIAA